MGDPPPPDPWPGLPGPAERKSTNNRSYVLRMEGVTNAIPRSAKIIGQTIRAAIGHPAYKIESEARGTALRITVKGENDRDGLLKVKELCNGQLIKMMIHPAANKTRAVVVCPEIIDDTAEDLIKGLSKYRVSDIKRITRKENGKPVNTATIIVTFEGIEVPELMYYEYVVLRTRIFYPAPMRCFKCFSFGHTQMKCSATMGSCWHCSQQEHCEKDSRCDNQQFCKNCKKDDHSVASKKCPIFVKESDIQKIKTDKKCSYPEAKRIWEKQNGNSTYAATLGHGSQGMSLEYMVTLLKQKENTIEELRNSKQQVDENSQLNELRMEIRKLASTINGQAARIKQLEEENKTLKATEPKRTHPEKDFDKLVNYHTEQIRAKDDYIILLQNKLKEKRQVITKNQTEMAGYREHLDLTPHTYTPQTPETTHAAPIAPVPKRKIDTQSSTTDKRARSPRPRNESAGTSGESEEENTHTKNNRSTNFLQPPQRSTSRTRQGKTRLP